MAAAVTTRPSPVVYDLAIPLLSDPLEVAVCGCLLVGVIIWWVPGVGADGETVGVLVSCGLVVSSVWSLDTSAFAKVGAMVERASARAMSSSFWDLSDVLVSGFIGGWGNLS